MYYGMPSILYHLAFAELIARKLESTMEFDKAKFMAGNLIPDLATNKQMSHYRKKASVDGILVPELKEARRELFVPKDSVKFGIYSHLYLDYYFIEGYLLSEFIWDTKRMRVINPRSKKQWPIRGFFSNYGMYGAYAEMNHLLVKDGRVPIEIVRQIPKDLPTTGLSVFDTRRNKSWKAEFEYFLRQKKEYTGDVFDYDRLWSYIEKIATQFVDECLR